MSVSYQVHSLNDSREWSAYFAKGATSIKIDPHWLASLPTSDETGILSLPLSHDGPLLSTSLPYSTLSSLIQFFTIPPTSVHGKTIEVALCFKSAPPDLCTMPRSPAVTDWFSRVDSFFAAMSDLIPTIKSDYNLTLILTLDGDGKPWDCKSDMWQPHKSVWIETDEQSASCFDSDAGLCSRFTILNDPDKSDWENLALPDVHYGKFGYKTDQTLQLWEPDSQERIDELIGTYTSSRDAGTPSGGGLAFAINIDQSMFDVFSSRSLTGSDARGFDMLLAGSEGASGAALTKMANNVFEVTWGDERDGRKIVTSDGSFESIEVQELGEASPPPLDAPGAADVVFKTDGVFVYGSTVTSGWKKVGVGSAFSSSTLHDQVLLVTEGNHCYNSHSHNTRSAPLVCRPKALPEHGCGGALDYSLGSGENWVSWLEAEHDTTVTVCNEFILHGTWGLGSNPSAVLFDLGEEEEVGVLVSYEVYGGTAENDCGTPIRGGEGIGLSSWSSRKVGGVYEFVQGGEDWEPLGAPLGAGEESERGGRWEGALAGGLLLVTGLVAGALLHRKRRTKKSRELGFKHALIV